MRMTQTSFHLAQDLLGAAPPVLLRNGRFDLGDVIVFEGANHRFRQYQAQGDQVRFYIQASLT